MAEVADILSRPEQIAILPDLAAGCSMADMANESNVQKCWDELAAIIYVESTLRLLLILTQRLTLRR